jgi:predicted peptidase
LIGFSQYLFVDKGNDTVIPFRFRKSKKDGQPLIVYFGGGGTLGYDNNKTLQEFLFFANGKKVIKKDYNILIPQQMHSEEGSEDKIFDIYTKNCAVIINELANKHNVDKNRIYTFGTSAGAKCVWKALINNPDMFAGAVEAMGMIYNYENVDFEKISHIPIWLSHSSDDTVVKIDSDDYCYEKLKSLGADIKYTRWEKYGHKMSEKFYKSEPWLEWLSTKTK